MSEEEKIEEVSNRADPYFKLLTRLEAQKYGLQASETELQYSPRADLVLVVPPGVSVAGTMFDFFRTTNVVEFKGQNDRFDLREYNLNELRTTLAFLQSKDKDFRNFLNVIVSARWPRTFLQTALENEISFQAVEGRPWLLRARVGFQNVAIVVCNRLPLEEKYYRWLAFVPAGTTLWKQFVEAIVEAGNLELIDAVRRMRPKEFNMTIEELMDQMGINYKLTPKEDAAYNRELIETLEHIIDRAIARKNLSLLKKVVSYLPPEERLTGLKPEERLTGLKPEERLAGLKPEERLTGLKPEERLAGLKPEERLTGLKPEERLAGLKPEERLTGLKPEERLTGLKPEERLAGLKPDDMLAAMKPEERQELLKKLLEEQAKEQANEEEKPPTS